MHLHLYLYICVSCTYMCIQNVQLHVHTLWLHSGSSSSSHKLDMNNNGESANYDMQTPSAAQPLIKLPHRARSWRGLLCAYSSRDLGRTLHSITTLSFALAVAQYTGQGPARDISSACQIQVATVEGPPVLKMLCCSLDWLQQCVLCSLQNLVTLHQPW